MNPKRILVMVLFGVLVGYGIGISFDATDPAQLRRGYALAIFSVVLGVILFIAAGFYRCPRCGARIKQGARSCRSCNLRFQ